LVNYNTNNYIYNFCLDEKCVLKKNIVLEPLNSNPVLLSQLEKIEKFSYNNLLVLKIGQKENNIRYFESRKAHLCFLVSASIFFTDGFLGRPNLRYYVGMNGNVESIKNGNFDYSNYILEKEEQSRLITLFEFFYDNFNDLEYSIYAYARFLDVDNIVDRIIYYNMFLESLFVSENCDIGQNLRKIPKYLNINKIRLWKTKVCNFYDIRSDIVHARLNFDELQKKIEDHNLRHKKSILDDMYYFGSQILLKIHSNNHNSKKIILNYMKE
jgi:hypothetical protein